MQPDRLIVSEYILSDLYVWFEMVANLAFLFVLSYLKCIFVNKRFVDMEKKHQEVLEELVESLAEVRQKLDELERKIDVLRREEGPTVETPENIELEHEDFLSDISVADEAPSANDAISEDTLTEDVVLDGPGEEESLFTATTENVAVVEKSEKLEKSSRRSINDSGRSNVKAVMDMKPERPEWYTAIPGPEVKDIRSAISLNDRVMFITSLFREDSMLFQDVVSKINVMTSIDKAVDYLSTNFPEWDMYSDLVYRFMMAVRRKLR